MTEQKTNINGCDINYLRVGNGSHNILLMPGALGTIWNDFKQQIEHLDRDKFTIVAWDPPGYGKSRPPDRTFPDDFLAIDATFGHNLMKSLGYDKYSVIGWSDGGISAFFSAVNYPRNIQKIVAIAANSHTTAEEHKHHDNLKNTYAWSANVRAPMIAVYGAEYLQKIWNERLEYEGQCVLNKGGDLCNSILPHIKCPTLIVQGEFDFITEKSHPETLKNAIKNSRVHIIKKAGHDAHTSRYQEFNQLVTEFLLEK